MHRRLEVLMTKNVLIAIAITALSAQAALALPGAGLIDKPFEESLIKHFSNRFFNRIDASDEQRQKLSSIITQRASETRPLREEVRAELVKLNGMMADNKSTDQQIAAEAQVLKGLRDKLMDERVQSALQIRAALTPEQRAQVSDRINGFLTGQWKHR
jgi:Spy/CpxP family protein refolding chaperone